ncbi:MAG TPA: M48 family metalloprotease [Planctomycetota bacterium]|nr:M48 family metalloprotease [Planctomycetota bacterium]
MKRLVLFVFAAVLGTLAVSAYRGRPDGLFARFRALVRPYLRDAQETLHARLAQPFVAGLLDEARCTFACNYSGGATAVPRTIRTGPPDAAGLRAVGEILAESGLQPNFKVLSGDVANASAFLHEGERVIVYSKEWLRKLSESVQTKWAMYAVLAHEIGHHLNGDTLPRAGDYRSRPAARNHEQELHADYFAGFVLGKLGATLEECTAAVRAYGGPASHSHPAKERRIEEHERGWHQGRQGAAPAVLPPDASAELVRLRQEIGRHAEHYGPGWVEIGGRKAPCLIQCRLRFEGVVMKVKGIRYDAETRDVAILDWHLDPRDGRPHPVTVEETGTLDDSRCHRVVIANAGEFNYAVAEPERGTRDPEEFARLLRRYVELTAR